MITVNKIATLSLICQELKQALTSVVAPETMQFVERYADSRVSLERERLRVEQDEDCEARIEAAKKDMMELPPASLFVGVVSASKAALLYLRWAKAATDLGVMAEKLYAVGWVGKKREDIEAIYKSLNAAVSAHMETRKKVKDRDQEVLFRRHKDDPDIVELIEWDKK